MSNTNIYSSKGQLILKAYFSFFNSPIKRTKNFCHSGLGRKFEFSSLFFGTIGDTKNTSRNSPFVLLKRDIFCGTLVLMAPLSVFSMAVASSVVSASVLLASFKGSDGACAMHSLPRYCRTAFITVKGQEKAGWEDIQPLPSRYILGCQTTLRKTRPLPLKISALGAEGFRAHFFLEKHQLQVNLCQKLLFLHQLPHNMTTDC